MNISHFCIDRPIFASVISIVITLGGTLAMFSLPIAQYPDITPLLSSLPDNWGFGQPGPA
jgi:multidrug efflux pump